MAGTVKARSALESDVTTYFPTGTAGAIIPANHRTFENDLMASAYGRNHYVSKTTDYTATEDDEVIEVDASGAARTITLPAVATTRMGKRYIIIKTDSSVNSVTVDGSGSELLNGATTKSTTTQYNGFVLVNNGSKWLVSNWVGS